MRNRIHSKREKDDTARNYAINGAEAEIVGRYGSAVKEHFAAYSGVDNEAGKVLKRGRKNTMATT